MATSPDDAPVPAVQQPAATVALLTRYLKMAEKGELQSVLVAYVKSDGTAAVQSSPMPAMTMNHLCRLIDRRVSRDYDRVMLAANKPKSPTGPVPVNSQSPAMAALPRKTRRAVEARQRNLQKLSDKKAKANARAADLVRNPKATQPN